MPLTPSLRHCSNKHKLAREGEKEKDYVFFFMMKSSSVERDEFSVVAWRLTGIQRSGWGWEDHSSSQPGEIAWRWCEGIGSRGHVVGRLERRSLDTSTSVRGQKEKMGVWAVDLVGWRSCVSEGENWLLIVLVLSVKKVAESSAVIEVVGGGEGGEN